MKRILSIMLSVMLVLSSFAVVSADGFSVIEAGANGAVHSFESLNGFYRISAEVYVTEDVEGASIIAVNGEETVAAAEINVAAGEWAPVSVDVKGEAFNGVKFITTSGKIYANNIKVEKLALKTLLYSQDFEGFEVGEKVYTRSFTKKYSGDVNSAGTRDAALISEFNAAEGVGDNNTTVANLYQPGYEYVSSTGVHTPRYTNNGDKDENARQLTATTDSTGKMVEGNEYYHIDIDEIKDESHIIIEFDLYNAANALHYTTTEYGLDDLSKVMDVLDFGITYQNYDHIAASEAPRATVRANQIKLAGRKDSTKYTDVTKEVAVAPKAWNKVTYEIKKEPYNDTQWRVESKLTYGGKTVENETYPAYVSDMGRLIFRMDTVSGGRFYIDNLKAYRVESLDGMYVERYSEDFDGEEYTVGQAVPEYTLVDSDKDTTDYSTFTVENTYSNNNSNYGRIYNKAYRDADTTRFLDDGTSRDDNAVKVSGGNTEYFTKVLPGDLGVSGYNAPEVGDTKKTRISFRYYLPFSTRNTAEDKDKLWFGFSRNDLTAIESNTEIVKLSVDRNSLDYQYRNESNQIKSDAVLYTVAVRKWGNVTIDVDSVCAVKYTNDVRYNHTVTFNANGVSKTTVFNKTHDFTKMFIGVDKYFGGSAFIDDIVYSTPLEAADVAKFEAEGRIAAIGHAVYSAGTDVRPISGDYRVMDASVSESAQTITLVKAPGAVENNISILLAVYKGGVLQDAKITPFDATDKVPFNNFVVNVAAENLVEVPTEIDGETFKVFVFNTLEGLVPLAEMRAGYVSAPANAE